MNTVKTLEHVIDTQYAEVFKESGISTKKLVKHIIKTSGLIGTQFELNNLIQGDLREFLRICCSDFEFARKKIGGHWELWEVDFMDKPLWNHPRKCRKIEPDNRCLNDVALLKCEDWGKGSLE